MRVIISTRIKLGRHEARMVENKKKLENIKEREVLEDLDLGGRVLQN